MKFSSQPKTIPLELFTPDLDQLPKHNRWVQLGDTLPWDKIELIYNSRLNNVNRGAGNKPPRDALDIRAIGGKVAEALVAQAWVDDPLDLFSLTLPQVEAFRIGDE